MTRIFLKDSALRHFRQYVKYRFSMNTNLCFEKPKTNLIGRNIYVILILAVSYSDAFTPVFTKSSPSL